MSAYLPIIVCAVLSLVLGAIWYGPLFGKTWMRIIGVTDMDIERRKEMQKKAMPLYLVQFILSLFQLFVLAHLTGATAISGLMSALLVFGGFVLPTLAGSCMWTNEPRKMAWTRFLVQAGYQLVSLAIFGIILGVWH
jgi:hypothetical protein